MNKRLSRKFAKMRRVKQFGVDHPLTPANPAAAAEYTAVSNAIAEVEAMAEIELELDRTGKGDRSGRNQQVMASFHHLHRSLRQ